ncbi:MAG: winged helix-turn-helix transcriptional regulator [Candidatus Heimdallarchaeum aukensis]|uniref:Winged helix-turn-helix transcriptional regulator n=1 Tax=Candidatus Heimdallarchaeum aukensis TaxID=2876573 RepID=A0A9Y1BJ20_9ARCH|nr:MAG: winged helix-turn-helix transcriptional regulator [Candidatus Heimdallarchaeum aukensis]
MGYRRMREREGSLSLLEQKGALRILLYLLSEKKAMITQLIDNIPGIAQTSVYTSLNKLLVLELIEEEYLPPYNKRVFSLTEKGTKVAEFIQEIQKIIDE